MSKEKILFDLLKTHEYNNLINLIKVNDKLDLNQPDETNTYLIQYAILFRQKDLVALLISKNCKLDILDNEGRNIFYIPIKFGYNDIVDLLIKFSTTVIGIPLLEMQDTKKNIPLHYAIFFNKFDIIENILKSKSNINFKDEDGNTALHLIVKNIKQEYIYLIDMMIENKLGINHVNKLGQNALHIAVENNKKEVCVKLLKYKINIDTETINNHLTSLLVATIQDNYDICELLLKFNPNIDCQDALGNNVLNHAIINKSKKLVNLFYNKVDVNLINIDGNTSANLFFIEKYAVNKLNEYKFDEILVKTKINIQNNTGKTLWHYLIENDIWEQYSDILKEKRNKIFIQDNNGITPYSMIEKNYKNKINIFIDIIATSFYNYVINNPSIEFVVNVDCIKQSKSNKDKENCISEIKDLIIKKNISYPEDKKSQQLNDFLYDNIKFSSYTGISLDVLMGLIYICKKFNTVQTTLTKNFMKNQILEDYYSANGIQKGLYDDFLNFELIWSYQKLFFPTTLKTTIHDFLKNNNKRFLIIPIGIELTVGAHANILLYDKINNEMERFEPYGKDFPPGFNYNPSGLDNNLKNYFKNYFDIDNNLLITRELDGSNNTNGKKPFKYITPFEYELKIGFQTLDTLEYSKEKYIGDPGGFCEVWSLWYVEMRLTNLNIERKDIIYKLINYIRSKQISFRSIIRGFTKNITDIRDEYLLKVGLDINKWLNENYTKEQWENLINLIKNDIKNDV